jgi:aldehyde dehydrogenase (NAD+)
MNALLDKLHLRDVNPGACSGPEGWIEDKDGRELVSYNPATGERIATVIQATAKTYDEVVRRAAARFATWRHVPARPRSRSASWSRLRWARSRSRARAKCRR